MGFKQAYVATCDGEGCNQKITVSTINGIFAWDIMMEKGWSCPFKSTTITFCPKCTKKGM